MKKWRHQEPPYSPIDPESEYRPGPFPVIEIAVIALIGTLLALGVVVCADKAFQVGIFT